VDIRPIRPANYFNVIFTRVAHRSLVPTNPVCRPRTSPSPDTPRSGPTTAKWGKGIGRGLLGLPSLSAGLLGYRDTGVILTPVS
jgi:hypothetical protein